MRVWTVFVVFTYCGRDCYAKSVFLYVVATERKNYFGRLRTSGKSKLAVFGLILVSHMTSKVIME